MRVDKQDLCWRLYWATFSKKGNLIAYSRGFAVISGNFCILMKSKDPRRWLEGECSNVVDEIFQQQSAGTYDRPVPREFVTETPFSFSSANVRKRTFELALKWTIAEMNGAEQAYSRLWSKHSSENITNLSNLVKQGLSPLSIFKIRRQNRAEMC